MPFYTLLWHNRCQSDFDELVSMASRPVDRGFGWMGSVLMSFHPAKCGFCRMGCSQQKTPFGRTFPFLTKWFPPLSRGWHCPQGVLLARRRIRHLCSGRWSSGCFGFTWGLVEFRKMLWRLPPIHFGRADGVERTLLRVACQSETFLASPWQGGAILHASVAQSLPK